jgi:predicted MPP superfamily phosphohydrolase
MQILILHLSDIHLKTDRRLNKVLDRVEAITAALQRVVASAEACFIVISGDIAFSGQSEQYAQAIELISGLKTGLTAAASTTNVHVVVVPGNHDCDFSMSSGTRSFILENIKVKDSEAINEDIVGEMTAVQDAFFRFAAEVEGEGGEGVREGGRRLYYELHFNIKGFKVGFNCLNAAWMSRLHELQGQMVFPMHLVKGGDEAADLNISVFHHPDRWLESSNSRPFREYVEYASNIILTGHEHISDNYVKHNRAGAVTEYIEGAVLQDSHDPWTSGFNVIEIDTAMKTRRVSTYNLSKEVYRKVDETIWTSFGKALRLRSKTFINSKEFTERLVDTGLPLSHRSQHAIRLPDIFVYPDLDGLPLERKQEGTIDLIIPSERVTTFVSDHPQLVITGADQSGKSSLAKMIYLDSLERGLVPVLISGTAAKSVREEDLLKLIDSEFAFQYEPAQLDHYQQLPRDQRVLIVDDFDRSPVRSREGHSLIIQVLRRHYDRIIILASDIFQFAELAQGTEAESELISFRHVQIRELTSHLRYQLITKWVTFDRDPGVSEI